MEIGFTATAAEVITAYTNGVGFDAVVRGAWSNLSGARVLLTDNTYNEDWSTQYIAVRSLFGNSNQVNPLYWFPNPVYLGGQATLKGNWLNQAVESAGAACFYSEIVGGSYYAGDRQIEVNTAHPFRLQCDLSQPTTTTDPIAFDVLIWGATTNIETSAVRGRITNESTNYSWSAQNIPWHAMAGVGGQVQPVMRYHRPYLLPANVKLRTQTDTPIAGSYIAFDCEKIIS